MTALICGSIAYDTVMVFEGEFKDHILADRIHMLNVAFLVPSLRRNFGGCAGNIAYNLKLLGGDGKVMATVGHDFGPYRAWMQNNGLPADLVSELADEYTAQAYITTDAANNQITAFHPGAMNHAHENHVADAKGTKLGIVAPDGRDGMIQHAREFHEAGIPFIFDPGQGLPMFGGPELEEFVRLADYVTVNDYEAQMLQERTGKKLDELAKLVKAVVVTMGAKGAIVHAGGKQIEIPSVKPEAVLDPTGCGDAFRAGLLYGLAAGADWELTGRLASLMGSLKIARRGGQNHRFDRAEAADRFQQAFGMKLW